MSVKTSWCTTRFWENRRGDFGVSIQNLSTSLFCRSFCSGPQTNKGIWKPSLEFPCSKTKHFSGFFSAKYISYDPVMVMIPSHLFSFHALYFVPGNLVGSLTRYTLACCISKMWIYLVTNESKIPSWNLTSPILKALLSRWFSWSPGGIWTRSLEGDRCPSLFTLGPADQPW